MSRVATLLAIYGLLFLLVGEVSQKAIGWSALFTAGGIILIALAVCRMLIEIIARRRW